MQTYNDENEIGWRRINEALPSSLRVASPHPAREEWHSIGRFHIHIDRWNADDPRATVIMVHGAGGNGRMLGPHSNLLTAIGLNAVAPDLPGYGLTTQEDKASMRYDDWRTSLASIVRSEAKRGLPILLLGASMGGMLAYDAAAMTSIPTGLVATCFLAPTDPRVRRAMVRWGWMADLIEPVLCTFPRLTDPIPVPMKLASNMSAITNRPKLTKAIVADPKAGGNWMPAGFLRTFLTDGPMVPPEEFNVCPVLLAHPAEDLWTDVSLSLPFFERLRLVDHRLTLLDGGGHFPVEKEAVKQFQDAVSDFVSRLHI